MTTGQMPGALETTAPLSSAKRLVVEFWREVLQMPKMPAPTGALLRSWERLYESARTEDRISGELSIEPPDATLNGLSLRELATLVDESRADGSIEPSIPE